MSYSMIQKEDSSIEEWIDKIKQNTTFKRLFFDNFHVLITLVLPKTNIFVGYAIISYQKDGIELFGDIFDSKIKYELSYFEVLDQYKRKGYGRKLLNYILSKFDDQILIRSTSENSNYFYFMCGCFCLTELYEGEALFLMAKNTKNITNKNAIKNENRYKREICSVCNAFKLKNNDEECFCED